MISFPFDAVQGTYEITANADKLGSKVVDFGNNPAAKETFSMTFGCKDKTGGTGASDATTTSTQAALGSTSLPVPILHHHRHQHHHFSSGKYELAWKRLLESV